MEKCVYCLCVFGKPEYFQGAATLAQTIRQSNTRHDILLMVTEDVRQSVIRKDLYDHIVTVPYITTKIMTRMSAKQKALYETFMHHMPIKFNGIRVAAELGYRKVLLLDVDMIFVDNCDNIFELPTPATCWRMYNGISPELDKYRHGDFVPGNIISDKLRRGLFLGSGGLMLLEASINTYNNVISYLDTIDFSKNTSGPEEQMFAAYCVTTFNGCTNVGVEYNFVPWKTYTPPVIKPMIYHFHSTKPWCLKRTEWPDLVIWWRAHDSPLYTLLPGDIIRTSTMEFVVLGMGPMNNIRDVYGSVIATKELIHLKFHYADGQVQLDDTSLTLVHRGYEYQST